MTLAAERGSCAAGWPLSAAGQAAASSPSAAERCYPLDIHMRLTSVATAPVSPPSGLPRRLRVRLHSRRCSLGGAAWEAPLKAPRGPRRPRRLHVAPGCLGSMQPTSRPAHDEDLLASTTARTPPTPAPAATASSERRSSSREISSHEISSREISHL
eukprot:scaffold108741_cov72-Phaeocystis_antarctica.AAC.1